MITVPPGVRILLAAQPVDFRKGMDGLAALVQQALRADPFAGDVFIFRPKRADRVKILVYDGTGLVVLSSRHLCRAGWAEWPEGLRGAEPLPHRRHPLRAGMAASVMVDGILQPDEPEVVADCGGLARLELARVQPAIDRPLRHIEPDRQLRHRAFIWRAVHDRARAVAPIRQQAFALEQ